MAQTIIGINDAKAVKRWSAALAVDVGKESYISKKMMGVGEKARTPIQIHPQLEHDAGDQISYDLSMQLAMQPVEGDNTLEGNEENLTFYTDGIYIDQSRGAVDPGGTMTRKRTLHNLRDIAKARQAEWWARVFDEQFFIYLSGERGINEDFIFPTDWTGRAGNSLTAPDAGHLMYGGDATAKNNLDANDKFNTSLIDRVKAKAEMMGGGIQGEPQIQPLRIDGEDHYCIVMNPWQAFDLRTNTATGQWMDIQKAAMTNEGKNNPIFKGSLGLYNNVVLHSHKNVIRFSDYGAGANVKAARALFMGTQAGAIAFGSEGNSGMRFGWREEAMDYGNRVGISTSSIYGIKKCTFNGKDFGVIALDTAAAEA